MKKIILTTGFAAFAALVANAQTITNFTPGSIVALRAGDGHVDMSKKQCPSYFDQFNPNIFNSAPTFTDTFPTNLSMGATLFFNGQAGSEGGMSRSLDRTTLTFNGYTGVNMLQSNGTPSKINIPRGFTSTDHNGTNTIYTNPQWYNQTGNGSTQTNPRDTVTDGTNTFWGAGSVTTGGYCLLKWNPSTDANPFPCTTEINAIYALSIANNTLFGSIQFKDILTGVVNGNIVSNPLGGIYDFVNTAIVDGNPGVGDPDPLPDGSILDLGNLVFPFQGPYTNGAGFVLNDATNVCYVADTVYGVQKYTNNGVGTWSFAYNFAAGPVPGTNAGCYGLAVDFSGPAPIIYASTTDQSAANGGNVTTNRLVRIVDTNALAAVVTIAQAPTNEVYRGIALAPDLRPLILGQPADLTVDTNQTATFAVNATSPFALGYQWQKNGSAYNPGVATGASLSINNSQFTDDGNYSVVITNNYGAVTSSIAKLVVGKILPFFDTEPVAQTNFVGDTAVFSAVADGTPPLTYQWFFQGAPLAGQTTNVLVLPGVDIPNAGTYYLAVTNPLGHTNSAMINLSVIYKPVSFTLQPVSTTVITNSTITLQVAVDGSTNFSYQWTLDNTNISDVTTPWGSTISGSSSDTLTITSTATNDSGNYVAVVTNPAGSSNSTPAVVSVIIPPPASFVSYTTPNAVYFQDFNSLPNPGDSGVNTGNPVTIGGITYSLANPYDFAFPAIATGGIGGLGINALAGWYGSSDKASKLGAHDGDNTTGGDISYGLYDAPASANRALGLQATSTTGRDAFAVKIINNTAGTLDHVTLHYTGEYWRQQANYEQIEFGYYVDDPANSLNTNNVTSYQTNLMVAFPGGLGGASPLDGTLPANQLNLGTNDMAVTGWTPGTALWLVWQMDSTNAIAGGAQGLAIDNFSFQANTGPVKPTLSVSTQNGSAILSWPDYVTTYFLQQNNSVTNPAGWTTVGFAPQDVNGQNTVTLPATNSLFFRLKSN